MLSLESAPAVTIIGGPFGAGKTTLRDHLLRSGHGLRVAVLDNVDGASGEGEQVDTPGGSRGTLRDGCICCSLRGELVAALVGLIVAAPAPEHILIEASGEADPGAIAEALGGLELRGIIRHTSVLAVFDVEEFTRTTYDRDHRRLLRRQLRGVDLIVLGKPDRVEVARVAEVEAMLRARLPRARILVAPHGRVAPELVLGVGPHAPDIAHAAAADRSGFTSWRYTSSELLALLSLRRALDELPTGIFRAQGVARLAEAPAHRILIWWGRAFRSCSALPGTPSLRARRWSSSDNPRESRAGRYEPCSTPVSTARARPPPLSSHRLSPRPPGCSDMRKGRVRISCTVAMALH